MTNPTDAVLVQQSLDGDKAAFSLLVTRHLPRVRRVLLATVRHAADVDDLLQETFLQAYLSLDKLRDPSRFRAWACGIGLNLARMQYRALPKELVSWEMVDGWETAVSDTKPTPEQLAEKQLTLARLQQAIADLPPAEREALLLVYRDGLTHKETAVQLNASISAIKVRVHRGRRRLRDKLQPDWGDVPPPRRQFDLEKPMINVHIQDVLAKKPAIDTQTILKPVLDALPKEHHEAFLDGVSFSITGMMQMWDIMQSLPDEQRQPVQDALTPIMPHRIVLLRENDGDRILPIWIGPVEAEVLALKLRNKKFERPITHDLITTLIDLGNTKLQAASISRLHKGIYYGSLFVQLGNNGEQVEVDCRVSDAINIALRLDIPITVAPAVIDETGVPASDYTQDAQGHYTLKNPKHAGMVWRSMLT